MSLYPHTIREMRAVIQEAKPGIEPCDYDNGLELPRGMTPLDYLLWMLKQVEGMTDPIRAARWIGWSQRALESYPFWSLQMSRNATKIDVGNGHDR